MEPIHKIIYHASRTEFTRYFLAGTLTFLADFLILFLLTEFVGINYLWSNFVGVCVGIVLSYILCVKWVFKERRYNRISLEFSLFALTCLIGILLNGLLMWTIVEFGGIHYLLTKIIVTAVIFVLNFVLKKILLFQ